jgi:hypothetical protein
MTAKPWFDRLTTLSKVEGESIFLRRFWTPAFSGVTRIRTIYEIIKFFLPQVMFIVTLNLEPLNPER